MIRLDLPADPAIHQAARRIAQRFAELMAGVLRDEEKGEAEREGYVIVREVLEELRLGQRE